MKISIIQAPYPDAASQKEESFQYMLEALQNITKDTDLVVLPEYSNMPGVSSHAEMMSTYRKNNDLLMNTASETAKRNSCMVAVNAICNSEKGYTNSTVLFDRNGNQVFIYDKQHLTHGELSDLMLDYTYKHRTNPECCFTIDGIKIGFLICYDVYFLEYIEYLASQNPDIILIPSYQRSEDIDIIKAQLQIIASRCNCPVVRAAYAMRGSKTGGHSQIALSDGAIVLNAGQVPGVYNKHIDLSFKSYRSNGHGKPAIRSDLFVSQGRTPQGYLTAGNKVALTDKERPYPRICAHRGFSALVPENTILSLACAQALNADEVEFDVWSTKDDVIIATHDPHFSHDRSKKVWEYSYEEILQVDASKDKTPLLKDLRIDTFEDILKHFNQSVIMNIHIRFKPESAGGDETSNKQTLQHIVDLIHKYKNEDYVYLAGDKSVLEAALEIAPHISRCCLDGQKDYTLVETAVKYRCQKLQLYKPYFNQEMIDAAHENGIICNVFWSDDPKEAKEFISMGIDTILTNNLHIIQQALTTD